MDCTLNLVRWKSLILLGVSTYYKITVGYGATELKLLFRGGFGSPPQPHSDPDLVIKVWFSGSKVSTTHWFSAYTNPKLKKIYCTVSLKLFIA